jgi:glycosyltransferase involved in cell wall biosynthesis
MPSKIYGILASGSPVAVIAPEGCELAEDTRRWEVGLVVPPERPEALAETIGWGVAHREVLAAMGARAREVAEEEHTRRRRTSQFAAMLAAVLDGVCPEAVTV